MAWTVKVIIHATNKKIRSRGTVKWLCLCAPEQIPICRAEGNQCAKRNDLPVVIEDALLELARYVAAAAQIAMADRDDLRQQQIEHRQGDE